MGGGLHLGMPVRSLLNSALWKAGALPLSHTGSSLIQLLLSDNMKEEPPPLMAGALHS